MRGFLVCAKGLIVFVTARTQVRGWLPHGMDDVGLRVRDRHPTAPRTLRTL